MSRIHINGAGEPGECHAEKQCPFGGDDQHHDSVDAAREAYEKKMEDGGYIFKSHKFGAPPFVPATKEELAESSAKAQNGLDKSGALKANWLSQTDKNLVQKIIEGKKVPDEKIDSFLDRNYDLERPGKSPGLDPNDAKAVYDHIRLVRAQSQTPSTLTTLDNFDPATHSVVGSAVREDPAKMAKAATKSLNRVRHLQSLADDYFYTAETDEDQTDEERAYVRAEAELFLEDSKREEVRSDAIIAELKWMTENDSQFAARANPEAVRASKSFKLRSNPGKYSVGTVRKVK